MGIRDTLTHIAREYPSAKAESFTSHSLANYIRHGACKAVEDALEGSYFKVRGSAGQSDWADVPWVAVFDPNVTTTATKGQYVVYLFAADMSRVYLTLAQGTTIVREEFKSGTHEELQRRSNLIKARLPEHSSRFNDAPIELNGSSTLARDYEPSVAFSTRYEFAALPDESSLIKDLKDITRLYVMLTARGGVDAFEVPPDSTAADEYTATIIERRRYRLHRKIDRDSRAAKEAKKAHGLICQGCGFDFEFIYGAFGKGYIEAHHLTPLSELPEDVPVAQNPKTDFAVLCANCHRMMHRKEGPRTLADLKAIAGVTKLRRLLTES